MTRRPTLDRPPTLDEHRAWAATATRNLTDPPLGADSTRRRTDARCSTLVTSMPRTRPKETAAT